MDFQVVFERLLSKLQGKGKREMWLSHLAAEPSCSRLLVLGVAAFQVSILGATVWLDAEETDKETIFAAPPTITVILRYRLTFNHTLDCKNETTTNSFCKRTNEIW